MTESRKPIIRAAPQSGDAPVPSTRRWVPWGVLFASILYFGADFIVWDKVFLPMDLLQVWPPWNQAFQRKTPINNIVISDVVDSGYPYIHFVSEQLKAGHIPFWNPHIFLGLPTAMSSLTNFVMNPLNLLTYWAFSPATAHSLNILINLSLIATFSYLLFRQRGLSELAALFGSIVFTFNGLLMVWLEFMSADFSYAATAASLYLFEQTLSKRDLRFLALNGLTLGILLLGGSVQWVFFLVPLLGLYACIRTVERWPQQHSFRDRVRPLSYFAGPLVIGVLIALPTILHFFEYMPLSQRTTRSFESMVAGTGTFYPELIFTFLFPNLFGYQPAGTYFARGSSTVVYQNYNEMMVYMGVATLILVACAFRHRTYRAIVLGWSGIVALALIVAMKLPGLYLLMYQYVPGFNGMQPSRIFLIMPPAFAYLSAIGMDSLIQRPMERREARIVWRSLLGLVLVLTLAVIGTHWYFIQQPPDPQGVRLADHFRVSNPDFLLPLAVLAVMGVSFALYSARKMSINWLCIMFLATIIVDLVPFGLKVNSRSDRSMIFPKTTGLEFLTRNTELFRVLPLGLLNYNTLMTFDIETVGGYASMFPASYLRLLTAMETHENPNARLGAGNQNYIAPRNFTSKLLPILNTKYLLASRNATLSEPLKRLYVERHRSDFAIFEATRYLPRAYVVYKYHQVSSQQEAIDAMLRDEFDPSQMAVGEEPVRLPGSFPELSNPLPPQVTTTRPTSDRLDITVRTDRPGLLVVSEQFFPGWEAWVGEEKVAILPVNAALMGIEVPQGRHMVTLRFFPQTLKWGLVSTGLTLAAVLVALLVPALRLRTPSKVLGSRPQTD